MGDNKLQILIEAFDSTKAAFADIQRQVVGLRNEMRNVSTETRKQTALVDDLAKSFIGLKNQAMAIVAIIMSFRKAWDWAEASAEIKEQEGALDSLAKKYNTTGAEIAGMLDKAADGLLTYGQRLQVAAKGVALGFNPQQIADFVYYASRLKEINPGKEIGEIADAIMRAASTGRTRGLVDLGVLADTKQGVKLLSEELDKSVEMMSAEERQGAATAIVFRALGNTVDQLGPKVESAHDAMTKLKNVFADVFRFLGNISLKVFGAMALLFAGLIESAYGLVNAFALLLDKYADLIEFGSKIPLLGKIITKEDAAAVRAWAGTVGQAADSIKSFQEKTLHWSGVMMGFEMPTEGKAGYKPSAKGGPPATAGMTEDQARKQTELLKARLAARIEILKAAAEREREIGEISLSNLQVQEKQGLMTVEDFEREKYLTQDAALKNSLGLLQKERTEIETTWNQIITIWSKISKDKVKVKEYEQDKIKALAAIDAQISKEEMELRIVGNNEDIRLILQKQKVESAYYEGLIDKMQEQVRLRSQLASLQVEFGEKTPLEAVKEQIAGEEEVLKLKRAQISYELLNNEYSEDQKMKFRDQLSIIDMLLGSKTAQLIKEKSISEAALKTRDIQLSHLENAQRLTQEYASLTGDYQTAYDLQVKILEIERQRKQLIPGLTPDERAAIDRYYEEQKRRANLMKTPGGAFALGFQDMYREYADMSKTFYTLAKDTAQAMHDAFSDFFFDAMEGSFKNLSDIAKSFFSAFKRALANAMADWATSGFLDMLGFGKGGGGGLAALLGLFSGTGYGGIAGGGMGTLAGSEYNMGLAHSGTHGSIAYIPRFHRGLNYDEFPAILQKGERVLSRNEVAAGVGSSQGLTINVPVNVKDPRLASELRGVLEEAVENTVVRKLKEFS